MDFATASPAARPHKSAQKSAIANGSLLPGVDGRSGWVRRCKELIADHVSDLGGADNASAAERSIIRRACVLTVELERLEVKFATAGQATDADLDLYQRTAGNLRRLLEAVGLQRRAKQATVNDRMLTVEDMRKKYERLGLQMPVFEGDHEDVSEECFSARRAAEG
jgi:hypothetical protein